MTQGRVPPTPHVKTELELKFLFEVLLSSLAKIGGRGSVVVVWELALPISLSD